MIDLAAPIPTGRKPGNPARLVRHPFRVQRGGVMDKDLDRFISSSYKVKARPTSQSTLEQFRKFHDSGFLSLMTLFPEKSDDLISAYKAGYRLSDEHKKELLNVMEELEMEVQKPFLEAEQRAVEILDQVGTFSMDEFFGMEPVDRFTVAMLIAKTGEREATIAKEKILIAVEEAEKKAISDHQRNAARAKHRAHEDKKSKIVRLWETGNYSSRNKCADAEYNACGFDNPTSARRALTGTPKPDRNRKQNKT